MRDVKRIQAFCNRLARVWEQVPDWRFGQLICNAFGKMAMKKNPFYPEEKEMIEFLEKYILEITTEKEGEHHNDNT